MPGSFLGSVAGSSYADGTLATTTTSPTMASTLRSCSWQCLATVTGRDERDARRAVPRTMQRSLACISPAVITGAPSGAGEPEYIETPQRYVPLGGRYPLEFWLHHSYELSRQDDALTAFTTGYFYQLRERNSPEVIAFHWHPNRRNQPSFAHLHLRSCSDSVEIDRKNHVPTGHVSFVSVVRFAIVELGARPLRPDWEAVLADGEQHFAASRQG